MTGFYFYASNRQEALLEALAKLLCCPLENPLQPESIVVQHYGMRRWVSMGLATQNHIEANTRYLFPNELLHLAFEDIIPGYHPSKAIHKEYLDWILLEALQNKKEAPLLKILASYLENGSPLKAWQLAKQITSMFDQYSVFLPELLATWEFQQEPSDWQSFLWKAMPQAIREAQQPFKRTTFQETQKPLAPKKEMPLERISIFGLSSLPPVHVEILEALANYVEIHFFAFVPSETFVKPKAPQHALVESLGLHGTKFFMLMEHHNLLKQPILEGNDRSFSSVPKDSMLEKVQHDIATYEGNFPQKPLKQPISPNDSSIQVHSCHSRMREVEVLRDQLLAFMDQDTALKPNDILVMTPNIEEYAPFIQSVFSEKIGRETFPFSIADRSARPESKVISYLLQLLCMGTCRFKVTEVLSLLESEAIQKQFDLYEADLHLLQKWIKETNIRWGVSAEFRKQNNMPPLHQNTWEFGFERLLTGYAMPGNEKVLFEEVLPFDDIEGNNALILGRFLNFFEKLKALVEPNSETWLNQDRSLKDWAIYLRSLLTDFFAQETAWEEEWSIFWKAGEELEQIQGYLQEETRFNVEVLHHYLEEKLNRDLLERGFLGHGITFASMRPMRSIPFKVIALLGMNERAFPRTKKPPSFDWRVQHQAEDGTSDAPDQSFGFELVVQNASWKHSSSKEEDRYLFLETLLSCRQVFYISYLGQGIRDNVQLLPSTVVNELVAYLHETYELPTDWQIQHHLQAFHPDYFQQKRSFLSYSQDNCQAAQAFMESSRQDRALFKVKLPPPEPEWLSVNIEQLVTFFNAPAQFLLQQRLGVLMGKLEKLPEDEETFVLNALQEYLIETEQLELLFEQGQLATLWEIVKARGDFPSGSIGEHFWRKTCAESLEFVANIQPYYEASIPVVPLSYDFSLENIHLKGEIKQLRSSGLIRYRPAKIKVKDRLQIWLEQLVLHLQPHNGCQPHACLIGKTSSSVDIKHCEAIETPEKYLSELLQLYKQGLEKPLAFFPSSAEKYVEEAMKSTPQEAQKKANNTWLGDDVKDGEIRKNPYFKRCFEGVDLFQNTDFEQIAQTLLLPIFTHQITQK